MISYEKCRCLEKADYYSELKKEVGKDKFVNDGNGRIGDD